MRTARLGLTASTEVQCRPARDAERVEAGWDGALRSGQPHARPSWWTGVAAEKPAVWDRKQLNGINKRGVKRKVVGLP